METYAGFEPQVGEIRALRTFRLGPGGALYPLFSTDPWVEGTNTAVCRLRSDGRSDRVAHQAPGPDCSCGFYAYGSAPAAEEYPYARHVLAVVSCWGRVVAGTRGVRAQYCRIEALWLSDAVPADLVADVAARYPSTALYTSRTAMLAEHPLSDLDCYDRTPTGVSARVRHGINAGVFAAFLLGAVPARYWWGLEEVRVPWAVLLAVCFVGALLLGGRRRSADPTWQRQRLLCVAAALWLLAPIAGPVGTLMLRLPLVQLTVLSAVQRRRSLAAASRFPVRVT